MILSNKIRKSVQSLLSNVEYYNELIEKITPVSNYLESISNDLHKINFVINDNNNRHHNLSIEFLGSIISSSIKINTDLPLPFDYIYNNTNTFENIIESFKSKLEIYQLFWDNMDDIDNNTWVIEPENPLPSDIIRRISIGNNGSIQITVNPLQPQSLCDCIFLGNENYINILRKNLNKNMINWDQDKMIRENLMDILQIDFPLKPKDEISDKIECGICYLYKIEYNNENVIPDVICNNISFFKCN